MSENIEHGQEKECHVVLLWDSGDDGALDGDSDEDDSEHNLSDSNELDNQGLSNRIVCIVALRIESARKDHGKVKV